MMVLPTMPPGTVKLFETMFSKFIWNNTSPKIQQLVLKLPKKQGGLNLVSLTEKDMALKCTWIKILKTDSKCANLAFNLLSPSIKDNIFKCNLAAKDLDHFMIGKHLTFWHDMLYAWCSFHQTQVNSDSASAQTVWWNSEIRIEDQPIFIQKAYDCGLFWISDLYRNKSLISVRQAYQDFKLSFMDFYAIVTAIPLRWRKQLQEIECQNISVYEKMLGKQHLSQFVYSQLINVAPSYQGKLNMWLTLLQDNITKVTFLRAFSSIYTVTNIPKLRSFQYRLLHGALILNSHLYRWGKRPDNFCSFCEMTKETISHLFVKCPIIQDLLIQLQCYLCNKFSITIELSATNILWNSVGERSASIENLFCLITKQFIYAKRCQKLPMCFP